MFPCRLFSHCAAPYAGPGDKPSLGGGACIVSLQLLFSHFAGPYAGPGEEPGLGGGAWTVCLQVVCLQCSVICRAGRIAWPWLGIFIVHFHDVCPMHCHKLGRAFRLALAEANISFTSCFCMHCRAGLAFMKSFHTTALYRTCDLFSPMNCHAALCTVRFIYSTILHSTCNLFSPMNCHAALCTVRFIYSTIVH